MDFPKRDVEEKMTPNKEMSLQEFYELGLVQEIIGAYNARIYLWICL